MGGGGGHHNNCDTWQWGMQPLSNIPLAIHPPLLFVETVVAASTVDDMGNSDVGRCSQSSRQQGGTTTAVHGGDECINEQNK